MIPTSWRTLTLTAALALGAAGCPGEKSPPGAGGEAAPKAAALKPEELKKLQGQAKGMFGNPPLPEVAESEENPLTPEKVALGRMLYHDARLSKGQDVSCNSCHDLARFGVDNEKTSLGHKQQRGVRNSPTVYNAALQSSQFWDGRAETVEQQATMPITNPVEMAMTDADHVLRVLRSIPGYAEPFQKAFPGEEQPITMENVGNAIGAFERKLMTPSKFDAFLAGDVNALTAEQARGLKAFVGDGGCITCHSGTLLGGTMFQKLGLMKPWPGVTDEGRSVVTGNAAEKFFFKVPQLRNVTKTAPYLHDGSVDDLAKVVDMMAEYQLGRKLKKEQVADIVAFLDSLTGELPPTDFIAKPQLPESGPDTPKPDPN